MKKILSYIILFFMLSPMTNFVFLLDYNNTKNDTLCLSKTDIIGVQYELCKQAKNMIINFSDIVINDLQMFLNCNHKLKLFFSTDILCITNSVKAICSNLETYKIDIVKHSKNIINENNINICFVCFVFIFLIRYLGLLRLFNSPLNIKLYFNRA